MSEIERFLPVPASIGSWIKSVTAMLLVAINQLLGIMILDMITGFTRAAHQHTVSSTEMGWRGIKKLLTVDRGWHRTRGEGCADHLLHRGRGAQCDRKHRGMWSAVPGVVADGAEATQRAQGATIEGMTTIIPAA